MYSKFPQIVNITPAVLEAVAKQKGLTVTEYRVGTLKRCECEIMNLVETAELSAEEIVVMKDLAEQVKMAIGGE